MSEPDTPRMHATTILMVRKGGRVVIGGDGQVSLGQTIVKGNARKVRRLAKGEVIGGFAGSTADAFTLFERLEAKLEQYPGQLTRACVELTKDWRTDRYLRRICDLVSLVLGPRLVADTGEWGTYAWSELLLGVPGFRVAGGTDEILRNIIAERVLGLPGDIRVDKDVPFNQIPTKGRA